MSDQANETPVVETKPTPTPTPEPGNVAPVDAPAKPTTAEEPAKAA